MDIEEILQKFTKNRFSAKYFATKEEATAYLDKEIDNTTVGFGDSETLYSMDIYHLLQKHNKKVVSPQYARAEGKDFNETAMECLNTEVFLTSVNGATETGVLVNIDGRGNRVAGSLYGHKKVYFVLGINKIKPTLEEAIFRARNVAAPMNTKRHNFKTTPCAIKGDRCYDCYSKERICNALVVYYKKMMGMEMEVIIIGESLGF